MSRHKKKYSKKLAKLALTIIFLKWTNVTIIYLFIIIFTHLTIAHFAHINHLFACWLSFLLT